LFPNEHRTPGLCVFLDTLLVVGYWAFYKKIGFLLFIGIILNN
jgi:hypothetical protein